MAIQKIDELVHKFNELRQLCYQNFAVRITAIENYLSTLSDRVVDGSVIVNGAFGSEKISPVNISESELVQVYNDVPKVLFKNSMITELTSKSYRDENEPIFLENDESGKYWIITTDRDKFFLVPSINIKSNIYKLKTVEKLFDFCGDTPSAESHFILLKPAKVSSQSSGKQWKLEERGILEFNNPFLQLPLELEANILEFPDIQINTEDSNLEIKKMAKQLDDLMLEFKQSQQERNKLESQIDDLRFEFKQSQKEREKLELQIEQLSDRFNDLNVKLNQSQQDGKMLESQINKIPILRDFVYLQIDLLKVRLDSLEDRNS